MTGANLKDVLARYFKGDGVVWGIVFLLSIISLLAVYSSTGTLAYKTQGGNTAYYILKHSTILFLGIGIIYITHLIPYKFYSRLSQLFLIVSIFLLFITLFMGTSLNEASRWLTLPVIGLTIQTSDIAKLSLIMYIARVLSLQQGKIDKVEIFIVHMIIPLTLVCGLIMVANLSTALILFAVSMVLMFIGRVPFKYLAGISGLAVLLVALIIMGVMISGEKGRVGTWQNRIENFVKGDDGDNYQAEQSKIAIANGGFFGKGPGNSSQRNFLPHPYSDFIYAIIIEEYGFFGGVFILLLYLVLLYRAGLIVRRSSRTFAAFLVIGLTLSLTFQAMINMGVAVNLFPVTGQTLPLVSMGGSSLLFTGIAFGIILSVSRSTKPAPQLIQEDDEGGDEDED